MTTRQLVIQAVCDMIATAILTVVYHKVSISALHLWQCIGLSFGTLFAIGLYTHTRKK